MEVVRVREKINVGSFTELKMNDVAILLEPTQHDIQWVAGHMQSEAQLGNGISANGRWSGWKGLGFRG